MIIRCIDFETTGIPSEQEKHHAIVEVGWCDLDEMKPHSFLCNPSQPIPPAAMAVHHITDGMVVGATDEPTEAIEGADYYVAHNADYERMFYQPNKPFICTYKVALRFWPDEPSHSLQFLRYSLGFNDDLDQGLAMPPHRAGPDAYLCAVLMKHMIELEKAPLDEMVRWSDGPALLPRVNFGKHKGSKWEDVPTDYLEWLAFKSDMNRDVKANAKHHLKKRSAS